MIQSPTNDFTVKELYNIKERNYDWEDFKYELPRKYTKNTTSFVKSGALFCSKKGYLDVLEKEKKTMPGPNYYKNVDIKPRPQSGKIGKSERKTVSDEAKGKSQKENMPGPGAYFKRPQSAMTSKPSVSSKEKLGMERRHYLNEVEYLGDTTPGVGAYNLSSPTHIGVPKMFKRSAKQLTLKEKESNINPGESCIGTFDWLKKQSRKKDSCFFGRSKRFATESKFDKKPAPNSYELNNTWTSKKNLNHSVSGINVKNVYYH